MWIDQHPYSFIYLLGCVFVVVVLIFKFILFMFLSWIIKENILNKNLKKIQSPNEDSFSIKAFKFFVSSIVEVALSWIGVTVNVFHIMIRLLKVLREILVSTPEDIRLLRFPLRNNPNLSREAVWAYLKCA